MVNTRKKVTRFVASGKKLASSELTATNDPDRSRVTRSTVQACGQELRQTPAFPAVIAAAAALASTGDNDNDSSSSEDYLPLQNTFRRGIKSSKAPIKSNPAPTKSNAAEKKSTTTQIVLSSSSEDDDDFVVHLLNQSGLLI